MSYRFLLEDGRLLSTVQDLINEWGEELVKDFMLNEKGDTLEEYEDMDKTINVGGALVLIDFAKWLGYWADWSQEDGMNDTVKIEGYNPPKRVVHERVGEEVLI